MEKSLFKEDIKTVAKRIVAASNGNFKQTEVLDLLAKADGYSGYNQEYRLFANSQREIGKILNEKYLPLFVDNELIYNVYMKGSNIDTNCSIYLSNLKHIIQNFFRFKDGSSIEIHYNYDDIYLYKKPINIDVNFEHEFLAKDDDEDSDYFDYNIIQDLKHCNMLIPIHFIGNKIGDNIKNMNIYKFIDWFKECFDLEYRPYNILLKDCGYTYPINKSIESRINKIFYSIKEDRVKNCKLSNLELQEEDEFDSQGIFFVDVDYLIPHQALKIKLFYSFPKSNLIKKHHEFLSFKQGVENNMFDSIKEDNLFAFELEAVQIINSSDEFEFKFDEESTANEGDDSIERMSNTKSLQYINNPEDVFNVVIENKKLNQIVKNRSLLHFEIIKNALEEFDFHDSNFNKNIFEASIKKISYFSSFEQETYRYIFDCIDESLAKIMNDNMELLLTDIYSNIQKDKKEEGKKMKNLSRELFDDYDFRRNIAYASTKLDKIKEKEDSSNDIAEYVYLMLELIEQKYKFKRDDLFVSFIFTDEEIIVKKRLLDVNLDSRELDDNLNLTDDSYIVSLNITDVVNKAYSVNPLEFIQYIVKELDLKCKPFLSNHISELEILYGNLDEIEIDINLKYLALNDGYYIADIDYLVPERNIKIRLSYMFDVKELQKNVLDMKNEFELDTDLSELYSEFESYSDDLFEDEVSEFIFSKIPFDYAFAHSLQMIQFEQIDKDFKYSLEELITEKIPDACPYSFIDTLEPLNTNTPISKIIENLLSNDVLSSAINDNAKANLNKINNIIDDSIYDIENEEYKDEVVFSLYKYIFDTLDEKLLFTMNERVRKAIALTYTLIHNEFKG